MLDKLKTLTPRDFENLTYDLLLLLGVRNLTWRTPGSDDGRDLEGLIPRVDFSGGTAVDRWHFECKRYGAAIPWPTVFEKAAYAAAQGADYLLFISTSTFSPQCVDNVANWNSSAHRVKIRQWPGYQLVELLNLTPRLLAKYRVAVSAVPPAASLIPITSELAKAVQAAYAAQEFTAVPSPAMEFASALADLQLLCAADIETAGRLQLRPFDLKKDAFDWLQVSGIELAQFDRTSMRAFLAALRLQQPTTGFMIRDGGCKKILLERDDGAPIVPPVALEQVVREICFWGDFEANPEGNVLSVSRR